MLKETDKIFIAIPCMDMVAAGFAQSLATLNKKGLCAISFLCGSLIYDARNRLSAQSMMSESQYTMWFDSDMVFEPDVMLKLFDTMDKTGADIVSGLYFRRAAPYTPVAFSHFDVDEEGKAHFEHYEGELTGTHEVDAVGFGCVLMKTQVLADVFEKFEDCFSPIAKVGEDLSFCWRAKQLGKKIVLDTDVKLGHVGHLIFGEDFYKIYLTNNKDGG